MMNCCNICCDEYNKSTRSKVTCLYCDFEVCRTCCETYILSEVVPKCMRPECGKEWSRKFLREHFTNTFLTSKYKEHVENVLFDQEKALMPATQPLVEERLRQAKVRREMQAIDKLIQELYREKRALERSFEHGGEVQSRATEFVRQCPANGCRGFLSTQWKCGICEQWTCPECHELKGPRRDIEHTCDPNSVETAKLLAKDSKPCPKCQSLIFKISGCFGKDTPILMWNGSVKMSQDICVGDVLIGDDGKPRTVQELVSGEDQLFTIKQTNGNDYVVNSKHTLAMQCIGEGMHWYESLQSWKVRWFDRKENCMRTKQFFGDKESSKLLAEEFLHTLQLDKVILLTVDEFIGLDKWSRNALAGFKSALGVDYETQPVKLDPYLLGVWLGDGIHTSPCIASNDIEIQDYLSTWCSVNDTELVQDRKNLFRIRGKAQLKTNKFMTLLRDYKLLGNKHIPQEYIENSRDVRLKVLAGIIDTDGHVPPNENGKRVVIIQTREHLSKQVVFLAQSLGFTVYVNMRSRKGVKIFGLEEKDYKDQYIINISGEKMDEIPTILPRKRCGSARYNKDYLRSKIEVQEMGKGFYFGWTVDENHRFLLSDFTVVKNCDQMWCTQCHTAFSWKTGKLENHIHNPHYYEWQRQQASSGAAPRVAGDVECGRELSQAVVNQLFLAARKHSELATLVSTSGRYKYHGRIAFLTEIVQNMLHVVYVEMAAFRTDYVEKNQDLRIRYLENEIGEEEFKIMIQRNDRKNRKNTEIAQVMQLANTAVTDIVYRLIDMLNTCEPNAFDLDPFLQEMDAISQYCNNLFREVAFTYSTTLYAFNEHFEFCRLEKERRSKKEEKAEA